MGGSEHIRIILMELADVVILAFPSKEMSDTISLTDLKKEASGILSWLIKNHMSWRKKGQKTHQ